jgi:hydroxymethylbilane synthase
MTRKIIRIATRQSPLAIWQSKHVGMLLQKHFPSIEIKLITFITRGDKLLDAPLAKIGGKGLFVKELENAILEGQADIAVHSMKDVPMEMPNGLSISAILEREDPTDAFVSNKYFSLNELPENARIGTSSLRRECQIRAKFPKSEILSLRGNVNTRLDKLDRGEYDAIILASAGLKRLGLVDRIRQSLSTDIILPACGQGAIAIESRTDDIDINEMLNSLHNEKTSVCVKAERAMNEKLNGGCQVPIAGLAILNEVSGDVYMKGLVGNIDGTIIYTSEKTCNMKDYKKLGINIADDLLQKGAGIILASYY